MESVKVSFKSKIITLRFEEIESDIDVDDLTTIDYTNLFAEIITIPVLMNRVGLMKAQCENDYSEMKLDVSIYEAQQAEIYRKKLKTSVGDKIKWPTKDQVENAVITDEGVILRKRKLIRLQKEVGFMDALYWAVKSKEMKLNRISENMQLKPEDFEANIVEGRVNGILLKVRSKLIPDVPR